MTTSKTKSFFLLLFAGSIFSLSSTSCKKCIQCEIIITIAEVETKFAYPEVCDSKKDLQNFEKDCQTAAAEKGGVCKCAK